MEYRIGDLGAFIARGIGVSLDEARRLHALRRRDIIDVGEAAARIIDVGMAREREIGRLQGVIRPAQLESAIACQQAWAELVTDAVIGACRKMTRSAGHAVIAADAHIPEQGLAKLDGGTLVLDEQREFGRGGARHRNFFQGINDVRAACARLCARRRRRQAERGNADQNERCHACTAPGSTHATTMMDCLQQPEPQIEM